LPGGIRDIYLPEGTWQDANTLDVLTGPGWVRDYPAPLFTLPYFTRYRNKRKIYIHKY
jgi:alpha-glucosidase (family GH31 glycosyl hydrolase)